jgi:hypothetical protein
VPIDEYLAADKQEEVRKYEGRKIEKIKKDRQRSSVDSKM